MKWSQDAENALGKIPFFVRGKVRKKVEEFTGSKGKNHVDLSDLTELKKNFRPEFLNRLNDIIIFNPLEKKDIIKIVDLLIVDIEKKLEEKNISIKILFMWRRM